MKAKGPEEDAWHAISSTETLAKNATTTITVNATISAGSQFRITTQATNSSAATYIDNITFTTKDTNTDAIESIQVAHRDNSQTYNLNGQKVSNHYRGITIRNGKKHLMR